MLWTSLIWSRESININVVHCGTESLFTPDSKPEEKTQCDNLFIMFVTDWKQTDKEQRFHLLHSLLHSLLQTHSSQVVLILTHEDRDLVQQVISCCSGFTHKESSVSEKWTIILFICGTASLQLWGDKNYNIHKSWSDVEHSWCSCGLVLHVS